MAVGSTHCHLALVEGVVAKPRISLATKRSLPHLQLAGLQSLSGPGHSCNFDPGNVLRVSNEASSSRGRGQMHSGKQRVLSESDLTSLTIGDEMLSVTVQKSISRPIESCSVTKAPQVPDSRVDSSGFGTNFAIPEGFEDS